MNLNPRPTRLTTSRSEAQSKFYAEFDRLCHRRGVPLTDVRLSQREAWWSEIGTRSYEAVSKALDKLARVPGPAFPGLAEFEAALGSLPVKHDAVECLLCDGRGFVMVFPTQDGFVPEPLAIERDDFRSSRVMPRSCPECTAGHRWPAYPRLVESECAPRAFSDLAAYHAEPFLEHDDLVRRLGELREALSASGKPMMGRVLDALLLAESTPAEFDRVTDEDRKLRMRERKRARGKPKTDEEKSDSPS